MKKKILPALFLSIFLLLSACGTSSNDTQSSNTPSGNNSDDTPSLTFTDSTPTPDIGPKELPRPLTVENADEFLEILNAEATTNHDSDIDWVYYDGVLAIYCNGTLTLDILTPWREYDDEITEIIIVEGCRDIDNVYFINMPNLNNSVARRIKESSSNTKL